MMPVVPYTLVVVDMQPKFSAANQPATVIGVTKEIFEAKMAGMPVLVVEYITCGRTHGGFVKLLSGYEHKATARKSKNDGSDVVLRVIKRRKFHRDRLRVCGVNMTACVRETVRGLRRLMPWTQIEVVRAACGDPGKMDWKMYDGYGVALV